MAKDKKNKKNPEVLTGAEVVTTPAPPVDYTLPQQDELSAQITGAWKQMMALATSQGATRRDHVLMALATAHGVLKITGEALWPVGSDLPPDELHGFGLFQGAYHATGQALQTLGTPGS